MTYQLLKSLLPDDISASAVVEDKVVDLPGRTIFTFKVRMSLPDTADMTARVRNTLRLVSEPWIDLVVYDDPSYVAGARQAGQRAYSWAQWKSLTATHALCLDLIQSFLREREECLTFNRIEVERVCAKHADTIAEKAARQDHMARFPIEAVDAHILATTGRVAADVPRNTRSKLRNAARKQMAAVGA